eukprot:TRINITY_DN1329_c0_g2_i4.p2 TRINITY_DN1329_c0_g2~~TRINITY_DN1329_c0_g2_i4.p2  ORF type:complete len:120 (+),score=10.92 TRINITY_DN1329_c0_g2_i4:1351-1710(+)
MVYTAFIFIANMPVQLVCCILMIIFLSCWFTFIGKFSVYYAPPNLLGVYLGMILSLCGITQLAIGSTFPIAMLKVFGVNSLWQYFFPFIIFGSLSILCSIALEVYLLLFGTPDVPPMVE